MMMRIQLDITLKYLIMNELIVKKRIYLNARERYNIARKDDGNNGTTETTRQVKSFFRPFVLSFLG